MFERYIICPDSLRNVTKDGHLTGFEFDVRIAYYRGLCLSMVEGFEVTADGVAYDPASLKFILRGETFTFVSMETEVEARWEFNEKATVFVPLTGGLKAGAHKLEVVEILRISYMPQPARRLDVKTMPVAA